MDLSFLSFLTDSFGRDTVAMAVEDRQKMEYHLQFQNLEVLFLAIVLSL